MGRGAAHEARDRGEASGPESRGYRASLIAVPPAFSDVAREFEHAAPGRRITRLLANHDPGSLDDTALVEAIAAAQRQLAWTAAKQAALVAEMAMRRGSWGAPRYVIDELAARLAVTSHAATTLVAQAVSLDEAPLVNDALTRGDIDVKKAQILIDEVATLPPHVADVVQQRLLAQAGEKTGAQLRRQARAAVLAVDPELVEARHQAAVRTRSVVFVPAVDGMAYLNAYLPADEAMAAFTVLDHMASEPTAPDDDRSTHARRADALTSILGSVLNSSVLPNGCALPARQGARPHLFITAGWGTVNGTESVPGELAGYGAIPASMVRKHAAAAQVRIVHTDPATGQYLAGVDPTRPSPATGRRRIPPAEADDPPSPDPGGPGSASQQNVKGAIGPPLASAAYRPGPRLVRHILERDRTCRFPGCHMPGWRCQIDHIVPFDERGRASEQTTASNLHLLCVRHHQLKTSGRWTVRRIAESGVTEWTAPTGHIYRRDPEPFGVPEWLKGLEGAGRLGTDDATDARAVTVLDHGQRDAGASRLLELVDEPWMRKPIDGRRRVPIVPGLADDPRPEMRRDTALAIAERRRAQFAGGAEGLGGAGGAGGAEGLGGAGGAGGAEGAEAAGQRSRAPNEHGRAEGEEEPEPPY